MPALCRLRKPVSERWSDCMCERGFSLSYKLSTVSDRMHRPQILVKPPIHVNLPCPSYVADQQLTFFDGCRCRFPIQERRASG